MRERADSLPGFRGAIRRHLGLKPSVGFQKWLRQRGSAIRYRVGGLPPSLVNFAHAKSNSPEDVLRHVHARRYWRFRAAHEAVELAIALLFTPILVVGAGVWHTSGNGRIHARRTGRPVLLQFVDQMRIYAASGIMPATYYIFSLPDEPTAARARSFLKRAETKGLIYNVVRERMPPQSSLNDKVAFEERCRAEGLPVVPTIAVVRDGQIQGLRQLPCEDLFIKPVDGKGGRGAERWLFAGGRFRSAGNLDLTSDELLGHIRRRSLQGALLIQPRIVNDAALEELNCGALSTVRVLTCLDSADSPEVVGAALRMAVNLDSAVDNLHSGGITSEVDCETGRLGPATNLGKDPRIGWLDRHPTTGAQINGRMLQGWDMVSELAVRAHSAFKDRLFVGWDIALTKSGPMIVEGNSSPDLDIHQRASRRGMMDGRFAELLAVRLRTAA